MHCSVANSSSSWLIQRLLSLCASENLTSLKIPSAEPQLSSATDDPAPWDWVKSCHCWFLPGFGLQLLIIKGRGVSRKVLPVFWSLRCSDLMFPYPQWYIKSIFSFLCVCTALQGFSGMSTLSRTNEEQQMNAVVINCRLVWGMESWRPGWNISIGNVGIKHRAKKISHGSAAMGVLKHAAAEDSLQKYHPHAASRISWSWSVSYDQLCSGETREWSGRVSGCWQVGRNNPSSLCPSSKELVIASGLLSPWMDVEKLCL